MVECLLNVLRDGEGLDLGLLRSNTSCVQTSEDDQDFSSGVFDSSHFEPPLNSEFGDVDIFSKENRGRIKGNKLPPLMHVTNNTSELNSIQQLRHNFPISTLEYKTQRDL